MTSVILNFPAEQKLYLFPQEQFALDREERLSDGGQGEVVGLQAGGEVRWIYTQRGNCWSLPPPAGTDARRCKRLTGEVKFQLWEEGGEMRLK